MNRLKELRPFVLLACLMLGAAFFLIYDYNAGEKTDKTITSAGQVSGTDADTGTSTEEQREKLMNDPENTYAASRGDINRNEDKIWIKQAENEKTAPALPAQPVKPAAPAKPAAAPAPAPAKPAVKAAAPAPAKAESGYEYNLDLLARLITAEAQGEPYEAKVAVGAVVMNRVESGQWAGTIKEVIYQNINGYYQFTPVQNGWINKPAEPESIKAAKAAMAGADPTNGAQFYYDDKVTNQWILAKPVSVRIGHMIYAF